MYLSRYSLLYLLNALLAVASIFSHFISHIISMAVFFFYLYTSLLSLFPSFALSLSLSFNFYSSCRSGYLDDPLLDIHVFLVEYTSSSFILSLQSIIIHSSIHHIYAILPARSRCAGRRLGSQRVSETYKYCEVLA